MNAALFNTTFWRWTLVTKGRAPLFRTLEQRRIVQLWVKEIARGKGVGVHQINAQDDHLQALFELPQGMDERAAELFAYLKATVEKALLVINPDRESIWDSGNSFERAEPSVEVAGLAQIDPI